MTRDSWDSIEQLDNEVAPLAIDVSALSQEILRTIKDSDSSRLTERADSSCRLTMNVIHCRDEILGTSTVADTPSCHGIGFDAPFTVSTLSFSAGSTSAIV